MKNVSKSDYEAYICVVYSINSDSYSKTVRDWEVRELGHRADPTILKCQDLLLSDNKPPQEV